MSVKLSKMLNFHTLRGTYRKVYRFQFNIINKINLQIKDTEFNQIIKSIIKL